MNTSRRRIAVAAAALASTGFLAGCGQLSNPVTTDLHYDAADGVSTNIGKLTAQNLLIVNDGKSSSGKLGGLVFNPTNEDAKLTISVGGSSSDVTVPAGRSVRLDGKSNGNNTDAKVSPVSVNNLGEKKVGDQITVTFKAGQEGTVEKNVPILLDQYPYGSAEVEHAEGTKSEAAH